MSNMKYIVKNIGGIESIFIFSTSMEHSAMCYALGGELVSAGFVTPSWKCCGKSTSLGIGSRGEQDEKLIERTWDE